MEIQEKVGHRIKELRTVRHLTQEGVAFKAELDRTYMNHVENGKRNISIATLERIALALGVGIDEFFNANIFTQKQNTSKA